MSGNFTTNGNARIANGIDIAAGRVPGTSAITKFGSNPSVETGPEDVWDFGGIYTFSTAADITQLTSSNNGDTQAIMIWGLDTDWKDHVQTITLTGTTPKDLDTALIRVYRMINIGATDIAGELYLATSAATYVDVDGVPDVDNTVRAHIDNGNNQTLMAIYTIPAGMTGYFTKGYVGISVGGAVQSEGAHFTWRARPFGSVFAVKGEIELTTGANSWWQYTYDVPIAVPEKTDILIRCDDVTTTFGVVGSFELTLETNPV